MIFATVGTQLPFPRLINALNSIATRQMLHIIAQTAEDDIEYSQINCIKHLTPDLFEKYSGDARCIVAHAGIGTIITAQRLRKPLIVMPRRASLAEHRNDHQMATVKELGAATGIYIAEDEETLESLLLRSDLLPASRSDQTQRDGIINAIHQFISS